MIIVILLISLVITLFSTLKIYSLKKEMKKFKIQIETYDVFTHHTPPSVSLIDKDLEQLALAINQQLHSYKNSIAKCEQQTSFLKQTIANMSHDLRTPLTSVIGYIQMLKTSTISPIEQEQFILIAESRAKHLQSLLNDFFELSVIESSENLCILEPINFSELLQEILLSYYDRFQTNNIMTTFDFPTESVFILGEYDAAARIIDNLLNNTCKYGGHLFQLEIYSKDSAVYLHLMNEAGKLSPENCHQVFDRFYMADQTRIGEGIGLGLCIVKSLVEKMKGTVHCYVQDNYFHLTLAFRKS